MNDRELLEAAAKAAGIVLWHESVFTHGLTRKVSNNGILQWNPLIDDGDALRLAVHLRLEIDIHHTGIAVRTPDGLKVLVSSDDEPDANAATRQAIVRAAAAMSATA